MNPNLARTGRHSRRDRVSRAFVSYELQFFDERIRTRGAEIERFRWTSSESGGVRAGSAPQVAAWAARTGGASAQTGRRAE